MCTWNISFVEPQILKNFCPPVAIVYLITGVDHILSLNGSYHSRWPVPDGTLAYFDEQDQLQQVSVHSLAAGKKVILFGVPSAFTPTCSLKHVPGFIENANEFKSKGVDEILCISGTLLTFNILINYVAFSLTYLLSWIFNKSC